MEFQEFKNELLKNWELNFDDNSRYIQIWKWIFKNLHKKNDNYIDEFCKYPKDLLQIIFNKIDYLIPNNENNVEDYVDKNILPEYWCIWNFEESKVLILGSYKWEASLNASEYCNVYYCDNNNILRSIYFLIFLGKDWNLDGIISKIWELNTTKDEEEKKKICKSLNKLQNNYCSYHKVCLWDKVKIAFSKPGSSKDKDRVPIIFQNFDEYLEKDNERVIISNWKIKKNCIFTWMIHNRETINNNSIGRIDDSKMFVCYSSAWWNAGIPTFNKLKTWSESGIKSHKNKKK